MQSAPARFADDSNGASIIGALADSLRLVMFEHGMRVAFQDKTRRELGGSFWKDYKQSVRIPGQWQDTDSWRVNYLGHPIHGAAAGYIWLDHEPAAPATISLTSNYWNSRAKAMAWSAFYSLQFEIGPLSEASIGNVGRHPETTGWVDHVITPAGAFGLIVAEDAADQYLAVWAERHVRNRAARAAIRLGLNPGRTLSNIATGRLPWHRDTRSLSWR